MKRKIKWICLATIVVIFIISITNCKIVSDQYYAMIEHDRYYETVSQFIKAIDSKDKSAVKNMFSPYVRKKDKTLEKQVEKLFEVYPGKTDRWYDDGCGTGAFDFVTGEGWYQKKGSRNYVVDNIIPLKSDGKYYWCWIEWTYLNDKNEDKVGISQVTLYTDEAYYKEFHMVEDEEEPYKSKKSLEVFETEDIDFEIRCIQKTPYKFTSAGKKLKKENVEKFLKKSKSMIKFKGKFGEPHATDDLLFDSYYELEEESGEVRYLCLGHFEGDKIDSVYVTSDFECVDTLYEEDESE